MQRLGREASLSVTRQARLIIGAAVVAGALGLAVGRLLPAGTRSTIDAPAATDMVRPRISGAFELRDTAANTVRWSDIGGRWQLVFFGFTQCPEACPTTLGTAAQAVAAPELDGKDVRVLFISVDPGRDTPEVVRDYVSAFGSRVAGLTGDPAGIASAAAAFGVYVEKTPAMADGSYMVNHTASLFLLGPTDEILETIPYGASATEIAAAVQRHF